MTARDLPDPTPEDREFMEGYFDGRDPDSPQPSANRSHAYRHSWAVGRAVRVRDCQAGLERTVVQLAGRGRSPHGAGPFRWR